MHRRLRGQRGFTYIGLLVTVVVMGIMLTAASRVWRTTELHERETQLLFAGHAYRMAIASYFASGHRFPATLQDLLLDERSPVPRRHLRRLYPDPMTGNADWALVLTPDGQGIMGVASTSTAPPLKRDGFDAADVAFKDTDCYCAWQFIHYPNRFMRGVVPTTVTPNAPGSTPAFHPGQLTSPTGSPGNFQPGRPSPFGPGTSSPASNPDDPAGQN
jgi:type II secretory pathway pseudopilin PulG